MRIKKKRDNHVRYIKLFLKTISINKLCRECILWLNVKRVIKIEDIQICTPRRCKIIILDIISIQISKSLSKNWMDF